MINRPLCAAIVSLLGSILITGALAARPDEEREWPFYRPRAVEPPAVESSDRARNGLDNFLLRKLEGRGLGFAPEADRRTLARRLYFDLIGVPPSPEEIDAFVADRDPKAYEKLVDRLLDDRRHGERWARFWLDLARYADTAGYEGDPDLPWAWRYRDYVIDALNNDKPYDVFIREQIAGDEFAEIMGAGDLPGVTPERIVAMTFLRLAPFTEPRGDETRHELLSEMTSTVGSVFLGLTVGCARCHDHKYDRIPTKDFYRMKAFFATIQLQRPEPGDGFQIGGPLPAAFYRPGEKEWAAKRRAGFESEVRDNAAELAALRKTLEQKIGHVGAGFGIQAMDGGNDYIFDRRATNDGALHWTIVGSDSKRWRFWTDGNAATATGGLSGGNSGKWFGDLPKARHISVGEHAEGTGKSKGAGHRGHFAEILVYDHLLDEKERTALANYVDAKYAAALDGVNEPPRQGLAFWLDASDLDADPSTPNPRPGTAIGSWTDKISRLRLTQENAAKRPALDSVGAAKAAAVRFDGDFLGGALRADDGAEAPFVDDQKGSIVAIFTGTHQEEGYGFEVGGEGAFISTVIYPQAGSRNIDDLIRTRGREVLGAEKWRRYRWLQTREPYIKQHLKRLQPLAMSLRHSYGPPYEPGVPTSRIKIRGEYDNPGEVVQPGFLSCVTGNQKSAAIRLDPFKRWPTRSRRMTLAKWISSADNPLTARVLVNRLWHWHFGRGIVATPSDFGKLSGGPSHPELLDWLAHRFVESKWSIKAVHRLIVTSSAYRQTSRHSDAAAAELDPENTLLWRFRRRRLEAEAIRDSVLVSSGRLNSESFGLPIFPRLPGDIGDAVKWNASKWATDYGPRGRKRSIYIYQQRTLTMPFLQAFDSIVCDSSRDRRRSSVTPLQALAMYNGEFVSEEAHHFAIRIRREAGDVARHQIERAFRIALGRAPDSLETARMVGLIRASDSPEDGLVGLCRVLLNSNEFAYVD